jgi:hypothetical protein
MKGTPGDVEAGDPTGLTRDDQCGRGILRGHNGVGGQISSSSEVFHERSAHSFLIEYWIERREIRCSIISF